MPESDEETSRSSYRYEELSELPLFSRVREFERERGLGSGMGFFSRLSGGMRIEPSVEYRGFGGGGARRFDEEEETRNEPLSDMTSVVVE